MVYQASCTKPHSQGSSICSVPQCKHRSIPAIQVHALIHWSFQLRWLAEKGKPVDKPFFDQVLPPGAALPGDDPRGQPAHAALRHRGASILPQRLAHHGTYSASLPAECVAQKTEQADKNKKRKRAWRRVSTHAGRKAYRLACASACVVDTDDTAPVGESAMPPQCQNPGVAC